MKTAKGIGRLGLTIAGLVVVTTVVAGCVGPGNYWYEKRCWDVEPTGRTLENGPYHLICRGHATLLLWNPDPDQYLTDEMRGVVADWLEIPPGEVNMAHLAWWLHRKSITNYGREYSVTYTALFPEKCFITSTPFTDIQRQLFNWITWRRESLYRGENRKELRFAYFAVGRGLDGERRMPEEGIRPDIEYWVCIFDQEGNPLKTASSIALKPERVVELQVPGTSRKGTVSVRLGDDTLTMWNPNELQESDPAVVRGLLVEALNAMGEDELARLDAEK